MGTPGAGQGRLEMQTYVYLSFGLCQLSALDGRLLDWCDYVVLSRLACLDEHTHGIIFCARVVAHGHTLEPGSWPFAVSGCHGLTGLPQKRQNSKHACSHRDAVFHLSHDMKTVHAIFRPCGHRQLNLACWEPSSIPRVLSPPFRPPVYPRLATADASPHNCQPDFNFDVDSPKSSCNVTARPTADASWIWSRDRCSSHPPLRPPSLSPLSPFSPRNCG